MHGRRNIRTSRHLNMAFSDIVYDSSVGLYSSFELRHLKIPPSRLRTFARFAASGRPKMLRYLKPQRDGGHEYADRRQGTSASYAYPPGAKFVPLGGQLFEPIHTVAHFERGVFT